LRNCRNRGRARFSDLDDVTISEDTHLYRTIIADGVRIEAGDHFENAAIVRADMVRSAEEIPEKASTDIYRAKTTSFL